MITEWTGAVLVFFESMTPVIIVSDFSFTYTIAVIETVMEKVLPAGNLYTITVTFFFF